MDFETVSCKPLPLKYTMHLELRNKSGGMGDDTPHICAQEGFPEHILSRKSLQSSGYHAYRYCLLTPKQKRR